LHETDRAVSENGVVLAEFGLYELMKRRLAKSRGRDLVLWENALLGSVAGGIAAACTTPLDVVKTRLMTQTHTAAADRYTGVADALRRIHATEGTGALFSGIGPRMLWIGIGGAIFIGSYEEFRRWIVGSSLTSTRR
jgi:solute carrier family 25 S-adenosylmethionine transporter 26